MKDTLKKVFLMGLGAYELTRKKAESVAKDLEKQGNLSKSESKKFVNEVLNEADKARVTLQKQVGGEVKKVLKSSVGQLKKHLVELEKNLDKPKAVKKKAVKKKTVKKKSAKKSVTKKQAVRRKKR